MAIMNRELPVGIRLGADYKKTRFVCIVEAAEDGKGVLYALEDGKEVQEPECRRLSRHGRHSLQRLALLERRG